MTSILSGDYVVKGSLGIQGSFFPSAQSISDTHISNSPGARIAASKVVHQSSLTVVQPSGSDVAAETYNLYISHAAGRIRSVKAAIDFAAGGDREVEVDVLRSTGGGVFASVLSAPLVIDSGTAIRVSQEAAIAADEYAAGDLLRIAVSTSGTTGDWPQGLVVTLTFEEQPI